MKTVKDLLVQLEYTCVSGSLEEAVTDIAYDSRKAKEGCVFVALSGARFDGHDFISQAAAQGVKVVIVEKEIPLIEGVTVIRVEDTRYALALMSAELFDNPAGKLTVIGITGTKGKTTTAFMLRELLTKGGHKTGIIGTVGAFYEDVKLETKNTTPESYELHSILDRMVKAGCTHVVMEISSQAFMTSRVAGLTFDYGVFTNLSPDHIGEGEHKDFEEYLYYKSQIFRNARIGIANADDEHFARVCEGNTCERLYTFGCGKNETLQEDLCAERVECLREPGFIGIDCRVRGVYNMEVKVGCMGRFNAYNAMAAMLTAYLMGIPEKTVSEVMYTMAVRGRVEPVHVSDHVQLLIDYAHNAVSAESLLTTIREYKPKRLVCVFGAGGNRSKLRRYDMGEIAGKYADLSILTADNPRFEEVEDIIADIRTGMEKSHGRYIEIPDRKEAIRYSIEHAQDGDIIALFGKGHEDYQEIKGVRYPFDERDVIAEVIKEREGSI